MLICDVNYLKNLNINIGAETVLHQLVKMTVVAEQLFTKICSNSKLERDEAERLLERAVSERDSGLLQAVADRAAAIEQEDSLSWEQKLGYLKTERCLVGWSHSTQSDSVVQLSLQWLGGEEEEVIYR